MRKISVNLKIFQSNISRKFLCTQMHMTSNIISMKGVTMLATVSKTSARIELDYFSKYTWSNQGLY